MPFLPPWKRVPSYKQLLEEVRSLQCIVTKQAATIYRLEHPPRPPLATKLVLTTIIINDHIKITGNIMGLTIKPTDYVIGTLTPTAGKDGQGNDILSEIKAGSLVAYTASDPTLGVITPSPTNPLQFKVAGTPGSAGGPLIITAKATNDVGAEIDFTDTFTISASAPPPPPLATGFSVAYTAPADQVATPAPF